MVPARWLTSILTAVTVAVATMPAARAGESAAARVNGIYVCNSYNDKKQEYVSDVFTIDTDQAALYGAYTRFLQAKYNAKDNITCGGAVLGQMNEAQARAYQKQQWARMRADGFTIVETGWKFTSAEEHFAYICTSHSQRWTGTRAVNVFLRANEPIEIPTSAELEIYNAWNARLQQTHPEMKNNQAGCIRMAPEDAAARQKRLLQMDEQGAAPWELVHVPFSFTPSGTPAPALNRGGGH